MRTHYMATFPAASPGAEVTWPNTVKVYPDASTQVPLGNSYLDESLAVSVYSDAVSVALTVGTETLTVTTGSPSATGAAPASPGGSVPVTAQAQFSDNTTFTAVVSDTVVPVAWATLASGDATLLDFTDPAKPTFVHAGVYAVTVTVGPVTGGHTGKFCYAELDINADDFTNGSFLTTATTSLEPSVSMTPQVLLTLTWYVPAGGSIQVSAQHDIGSSENFWLEASVRQIA